MLSILWKYGTTVKKKLCVWNEWKIIEVSFNGLWELSVIVPIRITKDLDITQRV